MAVRSYSGNNIELGTRKLLHIHITDHANGIPALGQESRIRQLSSLLHYKNIGTAFQATLEVVGHPVLGGLHHEYELVPKAA